MIKFHIPDFYTCTFGKMNLKLIDLIEDFPNCFHDGITIGSIFGTFPNAIWNGGRVISGNFVDKNTMIKIIKKFNQKNIPLRFTFTNSQIGVDHLTNEYCNQILTLSDNGLNEIIINNSILEEYLRNQYPNFKFILSTTSGIRGIDEINDACERYDYVVLDYNDNKDLNVLNNIKNKDKIEILLNESCMPNCPIRKQHYNSISNSQLNNKSTDIFRCPYSMAAIYNKELQEYSPTIITESELYKIYVNMGFNNFKLQGRGDTINRVLDSYILYMVKPEYKDFIKSKF